MKASILAFILSAVSSSAFAASEGAGSYVGTWCKRYQDFTSVLAINAKDQVQSFAFGNEHHEVSVVDKGYVSLSATRFNMVVAGQDMGVQDFHVGQDLWTGKRKLVLKFEDGRRQRYLDCGQ